MRKRCEGLAMHKARVVNLIYPKEAQGFQTKMKGEGRRATAICEAGQCTRHMQRPSHVLLPLQTAHFIEGKYVSQSAPSKGGSTDSSTADGSENYGIRFYLLLSGGYSNLGRSQDGVTPGQNILQGAKERAQ
ncbi:hypothetical protein CesoFtcFv8_010363 [Champsocephalus esox]|uniref:Uncharacterized protein n=1 Tax=Champsocephalus esox TaxID=159716 RepID=A0AAN8GZ45_9TELE|nr:hypothetical protein CesoFtcFv8_010363 [Champsocephalus esox]